MKKEKTHRQLLNAKNEYKDILKSLKELPTYFENNPDAKPIIIPKNGKPALAIIGYSQFELLVNAALGLSEEEFEANNGAIEPGVIEINPEEKKDSLDIDKDNGEHESKFMFFNQ